MAGAIQTEPQLPGPPAIGFLFKSKVAGNSWFPGMRRSFCSRAWLEEEGCVEVGTAYFGSSRAEFWSFFFASQGSELSRALGQLSRHHAPGVATRTKTGRRGRRIGESTGLCRLGWPWDGRIQRGQPWFIQTALKKKKKLRSELLRTMYRNKLG